MRPRVTLAGSVLLGALLVGCSATAPASPTATVAPPTATPATTPAPTPSAAPTPVATLGARTFISDDGLLTIDAPAGAVPDDVALTATLKSTAADLPPELAGIEMRSGFYRLEPDGLTFSQPVKITRRISLAALGYDLATDGMPLILLALRQSDGSWSWLDDQHVSTDGDTLIVSGLASHTSGLFGFSNETFVTRTVSEPSLNVQVGNTFSVSGNLLWSGPDHINAPIFDSPLQPYAEGDAASIGATFGGQGSQTLQVDFLCNRPGLSWVGVGVDVANIGRSSTFFEDLTLGAGRTNAYLGTNLNCVAPTGSPRSPWGRFQQVCGRVSHHSFEDFVSLMWFWIFVGSRGAVDIADIEIEITGTADEKPVKLTYDAISDAWFGPLGLHEAGPKQILRVTVHDTDGYEYDATQEFVDYLGTDMLQVRYPQEDVFGDCTGVPTPGAPATPVG